MSAAVPGYFQEQRRLSRYGDPKWGKARPSELTLRDPRRSRRARLVSLILPFENYLGRTGGELAVLTKALNLKLSTWRTFPDPVLLWRPSFPSEGRFRRRSGPPLRRLSRLDPGAYSCCDR